MKKNTLNIIILTLAIINLVLNVLIIFSVIPTANKTNNMITKIASIIELELKSELNADANALPIDRIDSRTITNPDGKNTITVSLNSEDGKNHYAVATVIVSMDKEHEDYKKLSTNFDSSMGLISSKIDAVISSYTFETIADSKLEIQEKILNEIRALFQSDMIHEVSLSFVLQ